MANGDILGRVAAETLFNAAPDAWLIVDQAGGIVATNSLAPPLFGYQDLVGCEIDDLLPERVRHRHAALRSAYGSAPQARAMASGLDLHGQRADGSVFPVQVSLSPITVEDSTYIIAAVRDETEAAAIRLELASAREQTIIAEDRDRLARDLHDTVIQELFAVGLGLQSLGAAATSREDRGRLQQSIDDLDRVIRDIRGVIFDLGARPDDEIDIVAELEQVVRSERTALHFTPHLEIVGDPAAVGPDVFAHLRHVVREGLSNVVRHARATECTVVLTVTDAGLSLEIIDNGDGPSSSPRTGPGGRGLGNLGARARLLGGECEFGAADGGGSRLRWSVPRSTTEESPRS